MGEAEELRAWAVESDTLGTKLDLPLIGNLSKFLL